MKSPRLHPVLKAASWLGTAVLLCSAAVGADRGTVIRPANLYISPDTSTAKLVTVDRGREAVLLERTPSWVHVIVTLMDARYNPDPESTPERNITGWMQEKNYIGESTPHGDQILFGEAADSEAEASRSFGRKGAANDAKRLYYRLFDLFPKSPLAGEALYRSADIQWQIDREDLRSRHKGADADQERPPIDEQLMRLVHKKFPGTRWDDLAEYEMLENKLCAIADISSQCAEHDAEVYEKYAAEHPNSPKAAEAGYNAAYRWAAAMTIYAGQGRSGKVAEAQKRALAVAQKVLEKNASPEWNARAEHLIYLVTNNMPVFERTAE